MPPRAPGHPFAHNSERQFATLLDFYGIPWDYEPRSFPIAWDGDGRPSQYFTPDFYLPDDDLFIEITTMSQKLVTKKNGKVRTLAEALPRRHAARSSTSGTTSIWSRSTGSKRLPIFLTTPVPSAHPVRRRWSVWVAEVRKPTSTPSWRNRLCMKCIAGSELDSWTSGGGRCRSSTRLF